MKKRLVALLLTLLLFLVTTTPVLANYNGGILLNTNVYSSAGVATPTNMTDGSIANSLYSSFQPSGKIVYALDSSYTIDKYYLKVYNYYQFSVKLYDSSMTLLYTFTPGIDSIRTLTTPIANVKYVELKNTHTSTSYQVAEFDVYGSVMPPAPSAPTNLHQTTFDGFPYTIAWDAVADATQYKMYLDDVYFATFDNITSFSMGWSEVNIGSRIKLTAVNTSGESTFSNEITIASVPLPTTPSDLSVTGTEASGTLSWSVATNADTYNVYDGVDLLGTSATNSYNFTSLLSGDHIFTVSAINTSGESAKSTPVTYTVTEVVPPLGDSQNVTVTNTVEPTITLTINNASVNFGAITPSVPSYELTSALILTVSSNNTFKLESQALGDFVGVDGNSMTIEHLKVKVNSSPTYLTMATAPSILLDTQTPVAVQTIPIDMKLMTDWLVRPDTYSATVNFIATQI